MKTDVLFEKKDSKLIITFDKNAEYSKIKVKLAQVLKSGDDTFSGIIGPIVIKGRRFLSDEEIEIKNMISEKTDLEIVFERPKQMGLATIDNIFNQDTTISQTKVFKGMLRSGQRIEFEGSIVMLGDVNGGAEIVAEGNIIVLGALRGFAHAGAKGNRSAFVVAEKIEPTQLRIADVIMKHEAVKNDIELGYEIAAIKMGEIVLEK